MWAVQALERGLVGEEAAAHYRTEWMRTVGLELYRGRLLRHMLAQLTPDETEQLLQLFKLKEVREVMASHGDIDFQVHLFRPAVVFQSHARVAHAVVASPGMDVGPMVPQDIHPSTRVGSTARLRTTHG